jgi:hypothetical protein
LLEHAECVLDIESAQERLPQQVDLTGIQIGDRMPQPDRFRDGAAGQPFDVEADHGAFEHGSRPVWATQDERWVSRGCSRFQDLAVTGP